MNKLEHSLIIDKGNTQIKAGLFQGKSLIRVLSKNLNTELISNLLSENNVSRVLISSVGGDVSSIIEHINEIPFILLSNETALPIKIEYDTPKTLGVDRIANACAANSMFPNENILIVDAGSCITYDLILANGAYVGGAISPGMKMRLEAMNNFTANLPLVEIVAKPTSLGKTTSKSLQSGVYFGILKEIEGFIELYQHDDKPLKVILTGGDNSYFEKELKYPIFAHPNLTLKGLNEILLYNMV